MQNQTISAPRTAQTPDLLRIALRSGRPLAVDFLALWRKPEIADLCDGHKAVRTREGYTVVSRQWRKSELALKERFDGILLSKRARELLKSQAPSDDALLIDQIMYVLNVAWALYSRAVFLEGYRRSFESYLRDILLREPRFDQAHVTEAAQALRLSLGLPRFRPSGITPMPFRRVRRAPRTSSILRSLSSRGLP